MTTFFSFAFRALAKIRLRRTVRLVQPINILTSFISYLIVPSQKLNVSIAERYSTMSFSLNVDGWDCGRCFDIATQNAKMRTSLKTVFRISHPPIVPTLHTQRQGSRTIFNNVIFTGRRRMRLWTVPRYCYPECKKYVHPWKQPLEGPS